MPRINIYTFNIYKVLELNFVEDTEKETDQKEKQKDKKEDPAKPVNDPSTAGGGTSSSSDPETSDKKKEEGSDVPGMKPDDEIQFFYKPSDQLISLPWNWNEISSLYMLNAPIPTWSSYTVLHDSDPSDYVYVLLMPISEKGETFKIDKKELVFAHIGVRFGFSFKCISLGVQTWIQGAPPLQDGDKHYDKYYSWIDGSSLVSNGLMLKMISNTKKPLYRIKWPSPTILMFETQQSFSINVAALYDPVTRMTHLFTTHAGHCGGEYSGSGGITLHERILEDDGWEQYNVGKPLSVLNSYLIGDAPLRSEGGYCLGPLPVSANFQEAAEEDTSEDGSAPSPSDTTTQKEGGDDAKYYEPNAPYNFLATKITIHNKVDGSKLKDAFKSFRGGVADVEPNSFRLANYTSVFESSSGYKESYGGSTSDDAGKDKDSDTSPQPESEQPPNNYGTGLLGNILQGIEDLMSQMSSASSTSGASGASGYGGGLPYDGSYFEQLITPPSGFRAPGNRFVPFAATNSMNEIFPPATPIKKIISPGEPVRYMGVWRDSLFRGALDFEKVDVPNGTSVRKREYISGLEKERQLDYQDQYEGEYIFPYLASSPTAVADDKGNHYLAMETSNVNPSDYAVGGDPSLITSRGRIDLAYSRGVQGQFSIIRDVTYRTVIPPTDEEIEADEKLEKDDPDEYKKINDPNPSPQTAILPRLLVDQRLSFLYLFFVYKSYIWCQIIPTELFQFLPKKDGQLSLSDETLFSRKLRNYYAVKVTSFYFYQGYDNNPGDYSVFQDRHGDLYLFMEDNYPLEPTLENYQKYPYMEQSTTLKIVKSVNGGMHWTSVLPDNFNWFNKRTRKKLCISGYSAECDDIYVGGGPRNMEVLYDPDLHVVNLFFMMYGCILYAQIGMEIFQVGTPEEIEIELKKIQPYMIYGSIAPSIDVKGEVLSENDAIVDCRKRGITCSMDVIRRGRQDSGIMIPHRRGAVRTKRGNYRLFFLDERYRYTSLMSFDCGSTWYLEPEVLAKR